MGKVEEKLLEDFRKANTARKLKLAQKFGFNTAQEYEEHLTGKPVATKVDKPKKVVKPTIYDVTILDASGSMDGSKYTNSKLGIEKAYNAIEAVKDVNWFFTLVEFSSYHGIVTHCKNATSSPVAIDWRGATGGTPLYKTIIDVLTDLKPDKGSKVLVKIYTDGEDTDYGRYTEQCRQLLQSLDVNQYTVTFVGTATDVSNIIKVLGLHDSNTLVIENTGKGFEEAFEKSRGATMAYASNVIAGKNVSKGFYKKIN